MPQLNTENNAEHTHTETPAMGTKKASPTHIVGFLPCNTSLFPTHPLSLISKEDAAKLPLNEQISTFK